MFTGLITAIGEIHHVSLFGDDVRFSIVPFPMFTNLIVGESIAVNGACLTVERHDTATFQAFSSAETLKTTNLHQLHAGSKVNLERALALGDRLGGHFVSGHVDCLAYIESITQIGSSKKIRVTFPDEFSCQVIPKGSITLDGISLTVNNCGAGFLEVNIIPETQGTTAIAEWNKGKPINFETDIIGKYVQRMLIFPALNKGIAQQSDQTGITKNFLSDHGF